MEQDSQYLVDIFHSAQRILDYTADTTLNDFYEDVQLQDAVLRRLLAIGKAAGQISAATRQETYAIDWQTLGQLKSRLMKEEQAIEADLLWTIIQAEIPVLIQSISPYMPAEEPQEEA